MGIRDWLPAIFRSPSLHAEDANSADGAPVVSNGKPSLVVHDRAPAAEEAEILGNEMPPEGAAQTIENRSTWEIYRNPNGPDGTPNPFSSLRDTVPRPFISLPSTEVYPSSPRGPLRIVNTGSPTDAQALLGFVRPPDHTMIQLPDKTYWAPNGSVTREDFDEFKQLVDQRLQGLATQLLLEKKRAWEMERAKDAKIYELERHVQNLQGEITRLQESANEQWNRKPRREPQTYVNQETLDLDSEPQGLEWVYDTLPHKLGQIAVELALDRADIAKAQQDWVIMEDHSANAANMAKPLNDERLSARCEFYRAIALLGQGRLAPAYEAFQAGELCVGDSVSAEEADEWRQRLMQALNESPYESQQSTSTPIDQTLFQGFENIGNISSQMDTPEIISHSSPIVPVLRQPVPRAVLRGRSGAEQRAPHNPSSHPLSADDFIPEEETNGDHLAPSLVKNPSGRASVEPEYAPDIATSRPMRPSEALSGGKAGPAPPHQSGSHHYPGVPSPLSVHFGPESQPLAPLGRSRVPQPLVGASKRFLLESPSTSSSFTASSIPHKILTRPARRLAESSEPSSDQRLLPRGGLKDPASFAYPPPPRRTLSSGTSYAGSSSISPQTRPPDLDDNRQEFPVLTVVNSSPQLNPPGPIAPKFESPANPERSRTPLTEAALALFVETQAMSRSTSAQRSEIGLLAGRPPARDSRNLRSHSRERLDRVSQRLAPDGQPLIGLGLDSAESGSRVASDPTDGGTGAREATDLTIASPERVSMGHHHANQLETRQRISDERESLQLQSPSDWQKAMQNEIGGNSEKEIQPGHPVIYGRKRSRNDPDFDSLYDVSTSGTRNTSVVDAGDSVERRGADIERSEVGSQKFDLDDQRSGDGVKENDVKYNRIDVEDDHISVGLERADAEVEKKQ